MTIENFMMLLCGLGLFLYGMKLMGDGLELAAGSRLKTMIERLTTNKYMGALIGLAVTAVIQSSSATTVMVVGFVNAGIMNLSQAMGVIMGANIGTTVTGWLVSSVEWAKFLSPANLAPVAVILGVVLMLAGKRRSTKDISSIVIGFGILFIGISTMSSAVSPLEESEGFRNIFTALGHNPFMGIIAGALVTAVIQSSSASVGILQSLAAAGLVPFNAAVYIIMGQNIGTCVTAIISSVGAKKAAKTAAIMHLLFNIIGTIIFSIVAIVFFQVINPEMGMGLITQTEISSVHTIFNIGTTLLLFPVSDWIIRLAKKLQKEDEPAADESRVLLDERMLETPAIALQTVRREVCRMGKIVNGTMEKAEEVLFTQDQETIAGIREEESVADRLCKGITDYLLRISSLSINEKEHQHVASLLQIVTDMERVSDYCENISEYAESLKEQKTSLSETGAAEMKEMLRVCSESFLYAVEALEENSAEKARLVLEREEQADGLEVRLRTAHIKRLADKQCSTEAGIVFLDTLTGLERISDHARNIAEEVQSVMG